MASSEHGGDCFCHDCMEVAKKAVATRRREELFARFPLLRERYEKAQKAGHDAE